MSAAVAITFSLRGMKNVSMYSEEKIHLTTILFIKF